MKERLSNEQAAEAKPIFVCLGTPKDHNLEKVDSTPNEFDIRHAQNIDWENPDNAKDDFLTSGRRTYVISPINSSDKYSKKFDRCTGLIVAGIDKINKENISFLSHQDPLALFVGLKKDSFIKHLDKRLQEMKDRCQPNSITTVVFGGKYYRETDPEIDNVFQGYPAVIELIGDEVKKVLGFESRVENGPKIPRGLDDAYYINKERRLYLVRPKVNSNTGSFPSSDIENQSKKWE